MTLRIHDTRTGKKVPFEPLQPGKVSLYVCGTTVYGLCHIGHARKEIAWDVITRHLRASGFELRFVRNITDVDDKIINRAREEGTTADEVARKYTAEMHVDFQALGLAAPDLEPRATEHIAEMIEIIQRLEEKGLAYAAGGDVYYSVPRFPGYGQLSGQSIEGLESGARIEVGEQKQSPLDFAMWKAAKPGEPSWDSPWGPGRPGWHIECSAMAHRYLGEPFDIHGGGADLIFPHHENELAQSEGAFGPGNFARHWMHSGLLTLGDVKMAKSVGNIITIRKVAEGHDLEALRLWYLGVHYRSAVSFTVTLDENQKVVGYPELEEAEARLEYFYRTLARLAEAPAGDDKGTVLPEAEKTTSLFQEAMDDDFNTAAAIGQLYEAFVLANKLLDDPKAAAKDVRRRTLARLRGDLLKCGETLGIFQRDPAVFLLARRDRQCARRGIDAGAVEARIQERAAARAAKDFARADEIRKALREQGIELMDGPSGTTWRVI
ncbi:MAG TPA: cysteine--tRNA ligase [Polyangia bacterium]|jgi:cysteinyl-tRNA synthetase